MGAHLACRSVVIDSHLLRRQVFGHAELMLGLCCHAQAVAAHAEGQMQVTRDRTVGECGIQTQAGDVDVVIYSIGQVHLHVAAHRLGLGIDAPTLRIHGTGQDDVIAQLQQRGQVYALHIHVHVVGGIIDVVVAAQACLAAAEVGIAGHIHAQRTQVHLSGSQVSLRA